MTESRCGSRPCSLAVSAASAATCLPLSSASLAVSLAASITLSDASPIRSSSIRVDGISSRATNPIAAPPITRPSRAFGRVLQAADLLPVGQRARRRLQGVRGRSRDCVLDPADLVLHGLLLVVDVVTHARGDVRLVAQRVDLVADAGAGLFYFRADVARALAHSRSSFTVSMVCSGIGEPALPTCCLPRMTSR